MVSIRDATPDDAGAMARIRTESMRRRAADAYTDRQLRYLAPDPADAPIPDAEFDEETKRPVVAEVDGAIVGWGSVHLDAGVLAATFVDPSRAGDGIGTAIVERLSTVAREAGLETLTVHASRNAVGFYERCGFERDGEIDVGEEGTPELPAVEMTKSLP